MSSFSVRHTQLLLKKQQFQHVHHTHHTTIKNEQQQKQKTDFINSSGIVSPIKLMFIVCLIVLSISTLESSNSTEWKHVKTITNCFNVEMLGQNGLNIYQKGNNVDETSIQITNYTEMIDHYQTVISVAQNFSEYGFAPFDNPTLNLPVTIEFYYINGTLIKQEITLEELKQILFQNDLRDLLLKLRVLYFQIDFGSNKYIKDFKLILDYEIYSHSMLRIDLSSTYQSWGYEGPAKTSSILRNFQMLFAFLLIISYSLEAKSIYQNQRMDKVFRKNSLYWCMSLISLNFVALASDKFSPLCAMMQLLPILQNSDSSETMTYNFNVNLRYALPIVFRIIVPVYMILNSFIIYSMIMYPGGYFDDYLQGFFSYFYNNFQYGIYQIFIQIKSKGSSAYFLYGILYFYMVLVGSNLVPALFCTLIYRKIAQRQLLKYVEARLQLIICPKCHHENYKKYHYAMQININSPKSPYIKLGTKIKHIHCSDEKDKLARMYIQDEKQKQSPTFSPILTLRSKHKKARDFIQQLNKLFQQCKGQQNAQWLNQRIQKIQFVINNY